MKSIKKTLSLEYDKIGKSSLKTRSIEENSYKEENQIDEKENPNTINNIIKRNLDLGENTFDTIKNLKEINDEDAKEIKSKNISQFLSYQPNTDYLSNLSNSIYY